jgi:anti-anti-sigma factor
MGVLQHPNRVPKEGLSVLASRRNGIDRLSLLGELDRSNVRRLERELRGVVHPDGAVVLDLRDLASIDAWGLSLMERAARRARSGAWQLSITTGDGAVRDAFESAGIGHLLSGPHLSDLLDAGDGDWSPVALSPFPRQRAGQPLAVEAR